MSKTLITSRDPQGLRITGLFEAVFNRAKFDDTRAQRLIEHEDEFQEGLKRLIEELSVSNRFSDEEVKSSYGYPSGYKPKSITQQTNILYQLFPGIGYADEKIASQPLPQKAEGWFAIPRWGKIAPTYGEAIQKVLDLIRQTRNGKFCNYRKGQLGPKHLRQSANTAIAFQRLGDEQRDHDILVVPAQFGLRHRGRSVRRAREVMNASEFGLDAFAIGIMLLTHRERLQHYDDLWIDCAGDEFAPDADGDFSYAPYFGFRGGRIGFTASWVGRYYGCYGGCGSASAFLLQ